MATKHFSRSELTELAVKAFLANDVSEENARDVAEALIAAEADGQKGHGLSRLVSYCGQAKSGKVKGRAIPLAEKVGLAAVRIDAGHGFAFPAMKLAVSSLAKLAPETGIALAAVTKSHHCGEAGYHVEALARKGLVGLLFANTPKAMAPWGGSRGVFGTNPIAFAAPRAENKPVVIDMSLSKVARGKVMVAHQKGESIPEGWALDADGKPTTDPEAAMDGTMLPMGGAKGSALVLMVEIMAAALTAANFGFEASSFFAAEGPAPGVGQLLIAIDPMGISGGDYFFRLETLLGAILEQEGTRLPGYRRFELRKKADEQGFDLDEAQYQQILSLCESS